MQNTLSQQENAEKWRQKEWDNKMSQQARSNAKGDKNLSDREMNMKIAEMQAEGKNWEEIVNTLNKDYGISKEEAGTLDRSMHDAFGVAYPDDWSQSGKVQASKVTTADKKYEDELAQQDTIIAQIMNDDHVSYAEALKRYKEGNF